MFLTQEEKDILSGRDGEGAALALKVLVGIGEAMNAERLVPISRAHAALSNQEADTWFAEKLASGQARCRVTPTVNPGFSMDFFSRSGMASEEDLAFMRRTQQAYQTLGACLSYSCTPYLLDNIPRFGEISAYSESSATPFMNSVWGARTNRESSQSALCAAVAGRTPLYGLLLRENRYATAVVQVDAEMNDDYCFTLLGWLLPKMIGPHIPAFIGIKNRPNPEGLVNLGAELNTAGATAMYHVVGHTPEAPTIEAALGGKKPTISVRITDRDLREVRETLFEKGGPIDFVMFGCPHHSPRQVQLTASMIQGRTLKTELWILTSSNTLEMARRMGLLQIVESAGGRIVSDTCVDQPVWRHLSGKKGATDSPKCAYYTKRRGMSFTVRSLANCVQAALTGVIQ